MPIKSVSGFTIYVKNVEASTAFYQSLGFRTGAKTTETSTVFLNWFSIKLVAQTSVPTAEFEPEATAQPKGSGIFINIKVDDIDTFYQELLTKDFKPSSPPRDWPWGNREFVLRDPDGYKLVFYQNSQRSPSDIDS